MEDREFEFKDSEFKYIVTLVNDRTGIVLADHKRDMVYGRLARRLRELKFKSFRDYLDFLGSDNGNDEVVNFVNAITTNLTSFFRESHHFDHLKEFLQKKKDNPKGNRRIRLWSAACSSGMEPYSMAMIVLDVFGGSIAGWDIKILATDIDTNMLKIAQEGIYQERNIESIPESYRKRFVERSERGSKDFVMNNNLKSLITFKQLNLLESWPMKGKFDIIFCRNVVIYFSKDTQKILFDRMSGLIHDDGILYIGHSENLFKVTDKFKLIGRTIYEKVN